MSSYADALDLLESNSWDEADEVWSDELGTTVGIASGITTINFTRLTSLPSYYGGQDEADSNVFISISDSSYLWGKMKTVLGQNTKNGFEVFFDDVAKVDFNEQAQNGNDVGAITFAGFDRQVISNPIKEDSPGYVHALPWEERNWLYYPEYMALLSAKYVL